MRPYRSYARPLLLDLFGGAGGAAAGYYAAGFDVLGVDIRPQPRYPFAFVQADALDFLGAADLGDVAAIHASPPCQAYSAARTMTSTAGKSYPQLVEQTRAALRATGRPYVIENVPGAPLRPDLLLCGTMFRLRTGGHELRRHRVFELGGFWALTPDICRHELPTLGIYGNGGGQRHRPNRYGNKATVAEARELTGCSWMTTRELSQAIPPAYTAHIGLALLGAVEQLAA